MIVNTICTVTHTTSADASAWYSVPFTYVTILNVPKISVTLDGEPLVYGTDYTLGVSGLQLVEAPDEGQILIVTRTTPMTQTTDFQTGLIDPDEIEEALDLAAMRDQELAEKIRTFTASIDASVTLSSSGWVDGQQTVAVSGVTTTNTVILSAAPDSINDSLEAGVVCKSQGDGSLTFSCDFVPANDITINIAILK